MKKGSAKYSVHNRISGSKTPWLLKSDSSYQPAVFAWWIGQMIAYRLIPRAAILTEP
jgi:hypothetical protein